MIGEQNDHGTFQAMYTNGVHIGEYVCAEDGFYVYFPEHRGGFWNELMLNEVLSDLVKLNKEWTETISNDPLVNGGDDGGG